MTELKLKLVNNHRGSHLATFPMVAGLAWTGRGGGGSRRVSRGWFTCSFSTRVDLDIGGGDMLMLPEGDDDLIDSMKLPPTCSQCSTLAGII